LEPEVSIFLKLIYHYLYFTPIAEALIGPAETLVSMPLGTLVN